MFDLDGTLVLSDRSLGAYEVLPGAIEVLSSLRRRGIPFVVLTNGSAYRPADQAGRLRSVGLPLEDEQMLTPSSVAADLMRRAGITRALILGSRGVGEVLAESGIEITFPGSPHSQGAQAVYVGWHPECNMKDIEAACNAIWSGAKLYVASDVPFFATKHGRTMGYSYAIVGAVRRLTKARVLLTGKPSMHALRFVAKQLKLPIRDIAVVGDDPVVEIIMARRGGATALGVGTGMTKFEEWARQPESHRPHHVLKDIRDLLTCGVIEPKRGNE
ncbi:MAG TPA: HAD hydrolase-like protein [Steroidobacteraceae bacterium]